MPNPESRLRRGRAEVWKTGHYSDPEWMLGYFQGGLLDKGPGRSYLKRKRKIMKIKCRELESMVLELFAKRGWNFRSRVTC